RGYVLGRNLELVSRGAGGRFDLLPGLLEELVASNVEVIVAGGYPAVLTKPDHHSARRASMRPRYRGAVGRCEADQQLGRRSGAQCGCSSRSLSIRLRAWESETSIDEGLAGTFDRGFLGLERPPRWHAASGLAS